MRFDIITIFPDIFYSFLDYSLLKKAQEERFLDVSVHDLRDFTTDPHRTVDDKPFGGGRGMVLKVEPIYRAVSVLRKAKVAGMSSKLKIKRKVILLSPRGRRFTQKMASQFSKLDQLILICGRYEGVDERVNQYIADEMISIGDYVLMSGDVAALVVLEAVSRLIPGVVGKSELMRESRLTERGGYIEYPQYTRPKVFEPEPGVKWEVPEVLVSGDHKRIEKWRKEHSQVIE